MLERFDIDINSPDNGVFLPNKPSSEAPGSYHPRLNNRDYYEQLNIDFEGVSSRQEALDVLRNIRDQLLSGTYPGSRLRPEK
ncbi:AHH domain-containing protein [Ottowia sp.]|uniref:AHH domain-containing protein n=1 Tax=Ottowia sp. TaxID=1898956 RepID=UPI0039E63485